MRLTRAWGVPAVVVSALVVGTAIAGDIQSGVQVGDFAAPFDVKDITGPNKGRELCYRWRYGASPVVCVVARQINGPLTSLVKQLDAQIAENSKLKSFVVLLTDDEVKTASALEGLAKDANVKSVPLTLIADTTGPDVYQIAKDAEVTVMLWRGAKVEANHAFKAGELTEEGIKAILADLPKILK